MEKQEKSIKEKLIALSKSAELYDAALANSTILENKNDALKKNSTILSEAVKMCYKSVPASCKVSHWYFAFLKASNLKGSKIKGIKELDKYCSENGEIKISLEEKLPKLAEVSEDEGVDTLSTESERSTQEEGNTFLSEGILAKISEWKESRELYERTIKNNKVLVKENKALSKYQTAINKILSQCYKATTASCSIYSECNDVLEALEMKDEKVINIISDLDKYCYRNGSVKAFQIEEAPQNLEIDNDDNQTYPPVEPAGDLDVNDDDSV